MTADTNYRYISCPTLLLHGIEIFKNEQSLSIQTRKKYTSNLLLLNSNISNTTMFRFEVKLGFFMSFEPFEFLTGKYDRLRVPRFGLLSDRVRNHLVQFEVQRCSSHAG